MYVQIDICIDRCIDTQIDRLMYVYLDSQIYGWNIPVEQVGDDPSPVGVVGLLPQRADQIEAGSVGCCFGPAIRVAIKYSN